MEMAPAMTLKRMYHCVPRSMRATEPIPSPPPILIRPMSRIGKERRGGNRGQYLRDGLNDAGQAGIEADGDADGDGPRGRDEQRGVNPEEGCTRAFKQETHVRPGDGPEHEDGLRAPQPATTIAASGECPKRGKNLRSGSSSSG